MEFPTQFPFLVIPTGAGPGQQRITINYGQDGKIKVYDSNGHLVDALGGAQGQFILYDASGNMVVSLASAAGTDTQTGLPFQAGITTYGTNSAINLSLQDGVWTAADGSKIDISVGGQAAIFLTPQNSVTSWFAAEINTNINNTSGIRPTLVLTSPEDQTNQRFSEIEMIGSGNVNTATALNLTADTINAGGILTGTSFAMGSVSITPSAINTPTNASVSYSILGTNFRAFAMAVTSVPQNVSASIRNVTSTGALVTLTRTDNTTTTGVNWAVWGF